MAHPYENKTVEEAEGEIQDRIKYEKIEKITYSILCMRLGESLPYETIRKAISSLTEKKVLCVIGRDDLTSERIYKMCSE